MPEILVSQARNGSTVGVSVGDVIVVCLSEIPTTGFRWQIDAAPGLSLVSDEFFVASAALGAGGERRFRFSAQAPGVTRIEASLRREWESGTAPQAQFRVTIQAR